MHHLSVPISKGSHLSLEPEPAHRTQNSITAWGAEHCETVLLGYWVCKEGWIKYKTQACKSKSGQEFDLDNSRFSGQLLHITMKDRASKFQTPRFRILWHHRLFSVFVPLQHLDIKKIKRSQPNQDQKLSNQERIEHSEQEPRKVRRKWLINTQRARQQYSWQQRQHLIPAKQLSFH